MKCRGFTLVGLMVSVACSSLLLVCLLIVYQRIYQHSRYLHARIELIEKALIASHYFRFWLSQAGFTGCGVLPEAMKITEKGKQLTFFIDHSIGHLARQTEGNEICLFPSMAIKQADQLLIANCHQQLWRRVKRIGHFGRHQCLRLEQSIPNLSPISQVTAIKLQKITITKVGENLLLKNESGQGDVLISNVSVLRFRYQKRNASLQIDLRLHSVAAGNLNWPITIKLRNYAKK